MPPPQPQQPLYQDIAVRGIKMLDIGFAAAGYFILALLAIMAFNKIGGKYDKAAEVKKSTPLLILQIILRVWLIGISAYIARNVFPLIPWPFEGVYGYQHIKVKEVSNGVVFSAFIVAFDTHLQSQVAYLKQRLSINT